MSITWVGGGSVDTSGTVSLTGLGIQAGDIAVAVAGRANAGGPTVPGDWTALSSGVVTGGSGGTVYGQAAAWKRLDGTETTLGGWTNQTEFVVGIWRGVDPTTPIGANSGLGAATTTVSFPARAGLASGSWQAGLASGRAITAGLKTATLTSYTTRSSGFAGARSGVFDSAAATTGIILRTATVTGASGQVGRTFELIELVAAPITVLTDVGALEATGLASALNAGVPLGLGALTLTSLAPTVAIIPSALSPALGDLTLTGMTPALPRTAKSGLGALALAGQSLALPRTTLVGLGALTATGFAPSLPRTRFPGLGALSATGLAPGLPRVVAAGRGVLTLTGLATGSTLPSDLTIEFWTNGVLRATRTFTPDAVLSDAIDFTLTAPEYAAITDWTTPQLKVIADGGTMGVLVDQVFLRLLAGARVPGTAALDITGFAPTAALTHRLRVSTGLGALTLDGQTPLLPRRALTKLGTLAVTGFRPTLVAPHTTFPATGSLDLTGLAPRLPAKSRPSTGALTVAGLAPTVTATANVPARPGVGLLVVTGLTPTALRPTVARPDVGTIAISGLEPSTTATTGYHANVGTGSITLDGFGPTVRFSVGVGRLLLSGLRPGVQVSDFIRVLPGTGDVVCTGLNPRARPTRHLWVCAVFASGHRYSAISVSGPGIDGDGASGPVFSAVGGSVPVIGGNDASRPGEAATGASEPVLIGTAGRPPCRA